MRTLYTDMDIHFTIENTQIHALNIVQERFARTIPAHSHGNGCYEIHYIPFGHGTLRTKDQTYEIVPDTLFVTGPHVEHAQTPLLQDPMQEYCVYLKTSPAPRHGKPKSSPVMDLFLSTPFWIGKDSQGIHGLMQQLFQELEHHYLGYQTQVELLLSQLLVAMVRNYDQHQISRTVFARNNLADSKSVIIDEYFLYEYQALSLEVLSSRLNLSPRQTQRLLIQHYGKNFQQKKAQARMSAAAILLSDSSRSVAAIAEDLGYSSAEHFSSAFRNYYGVSPREYRKGLTSSSRSSTPLPAASLQRSRTGSPARQW